MVEYSSLQKTDVLFTHIDPDTGVNTVLHITGLLNDQEYKNLEIVLTDVDMDFAAVWLPRRGIEHHRVDALRRVPTSQFRPVTMAAWPDGTHLLVDGAHRYFVHACRGVKFIKAKLATYELWQKYVVTGSPHKTERQLQHMHSGIDLDADIIDKKESTL